MHKIFLAVSSMIVTHFLQKAYRKITEKPTIDKDEIYRQMKKAEYDARRAAARPVIAKLDSISTPRDGAKWLANIATVEEIADKYKEFFAQFKEPCEGAALRPCRPVDGCDAMAMAPGRFS